MKSNKFNKKNIMKICKILFLVLVAIFLAKYFYTSWDDIKKIDWDKFNWGIFILSIFLYFAYKVTLASLWHYITKLNKCSIKYTKAETSYLYSILGKYIPGKVFMLAARIPGYQEEGVPMRKVTICFFLENICTLLGAAFLFLISLFFFPNELLANYKWATIGLVILFFICINPKIINFFLSKLGKLMKKNDMEITITYPQMIKVVLLFICNWLIVGTGFYILVVSLYPSVGFSQWLYVGGIYGLSAIIGILAIFTVSGLGVREGILIAGLILIMPKEYAVIISIVSRLWATIAELILILVAFIANKIIDIKSKKTNPTLENQSTK